MPAQVKPVPEGYHSLTPYLVVKGAARLIDFVKQAFSAQEDHCFADPQGVVNHAELTIGDSKLMIGEAKTPEGAMPSTLYLYVSDADATFARAVAAGATVISQPADQFYGDRHGGIKDPCGNQWWIATHIEDVSPEELKRRAAASGPK